MNLRKADHYNIGLDLGTNSVSWAVVDNDGIPLNWKGRTAWGSRLFSEAETAANTRLKRGQRRRYIRRRWRLDLLQSLFEEEMKKVDPEFFTRLRQSMLLKEDKTYPVKLSSKGAAWPLFPDGDEAAYYKQYPTIYHLRAALMSQNEKADLRLIYLAFHNIVKARGNFLFQDNPNLSASNANMEEAVDKLCLALDNWCGNHDLDCTVRKNTPSIRAIFEGTPIEPSSENGLAETLDPKKLSRKDKAAYVANWLKILPNDVIDAKQTKAMAKELANAMLGLKANMSKIFLLEEDKALYLSNDEQVEEYTNSCADEDVELFESMQVMYSASILLDILKGANGASISACKVMAYEQYGEDLKLLKALVHQYAPKKYDEFFRGAIFDQRKGFRSSNYDPETAKGYTRYNLKRGEQYDDFAKAVKALLDTTMAANDARYQDMIKRFNEGTFLRRLKTSDNGNIPYQLHLEEMNSILDRQKQFYPFLDECADKLRSLVAFRIPYYVGPLTLKNAAVDKQENKRFAWSVRKEGMETARVYPWNWEDVIDRKASARAFMDRLTGTCTYLLGEPVLPKSSLLYEEYCVLNELNGAKYSTDGDSWYRFDYSTRMDIIEDLFKRKKGKVSYKNVEDWLKREKHFMFAHVRGGQGETAFESRLSSYVFFKELLGVDEIEESDIPMIENIIHWNTLFEDRSILAETIRDNYGQRLNDDQIKLICKKRFAGWGRLSKKLLCGIKVSTDNGPYSIMDILREGNPNNNGRNNTMVFMEILRDDTFGFEEKISLANESYVSSEKEFDINDLPGSSAIRRTINQAKCIVDEIVGIVGHAPDNIYVEVTRSEDGRNKLKRQKTRYESIKAAIAALKREHADYFDSSVQAHFNDCTPKSFDDERLALYFMQNGKCLYCGRDLDINQLDKYQVDHILPQSYIKDDSLDNKALVHVEDNQRKKDSLLLDDSIRQARRQYWDALHDAHLISDKKYKNLTRRSVGDKELGGFIARQMVETSQSIKLTSLVLKNEYPNTNIRSIKAGFSSELRTRYDIPKCREANDYHHAHDAYLACIIGNFITKYHIDLFENPIRYTNAVRDFIQRRIAYALKTGKDLNSFGMPGSSSFIFLSFNSPRGINKDTGEILVDDAADVWNPNSEIRKIKRVIGRKDCFVTRMPEETAGAFWDETIYSPHSKKKDLIPLKKGLDTKKYGGYSREQFAYFFVYEAFASKKGKDAKKFVFASVPVSVAASVSSAGGEDSLIEYAIRHASKSNLEFSRVVRPRILKYQLIELNGERLYVTGLKAVRNANQVSFDIQQLMHLEQCCNGLECDSETLNDLFSYLLLQYGKYAVKLGKQLRLHELEENFFEVTNEEKRQIIKSLIAIFNAKTNMIDLTALGSGKNVGDMSVAYNKALNQRDSEVAFIDQSITGMFERKTYL